MVNCYFLAQTQAEVSPLIGCPQLLIKYIRNYPPYLEAVSFIRNPRTRHDVVTGAHITWFCDQYDAKIKILKDMENGDEKIVLKTLQAL
jgi:hypothetical protein